MTLAYLTALSRHSSGDPEGKTRISTSDVIIYQDNQPLFHFRWLSNCVVQLANSRCWEPMQPGFVQTKTITKVINSLSHLRTSAALGGQRGSSLAVVMLAWIPLSPSPSAVGTAAKDINGTSNGKRQPKDTAKDARF